jgi:hypothetical protein
MQDTVLAVKDVLIFGYFISSGIVLYDFAGIISIGWEI